jgi:HNH endonuclease
MTRKRNYPREYETYHGTPEQIKARASRNKARAEEVKAGRVRKGDGKEVDHKDGNPMNNSPRNRQILSRTANRRKGG